MNYGIFHLCRGGGIGRRTGLKIPGTLVRGGSIPPLGRCHKLGWPYRLGVRTGDSQSSNRGSNPRRAVYFTEHNLTGMRTPEATGSFNLEYPNEHSRLTAAREGNSQQAVIHPRRAVYFTEHNLTGMRTPEKTGSTKLGTPSSDNHEFRIAHRVNCSSSLSIPVV